MDNLQRTYEALREAEIDAARDINLRQYTWFRTGGVARLVFNPASVDELATTIRLLNELGTAYKIVGETTNLLFLDDTEYSCLVCTKRIGAMHMDDGRTRIITEAGAMLPALSRFALFEEISGFTGFEGIPGTIGGAVFMNAGAYGTTIEHVLDKVEAVMPDGSIVTIEAKDMQFSYRNSVFKGGSHPGVVCRAFFRTSPGDQKKMYARMEEIHANRHRNFEYMYPNLGSIFAGSVYRSLGKRDRTFALAAGLFYFFNYRLRFGKRETPINRKWLNDLAIKRFGLRFAKQPFSDKSLNVLVNNNHSSSELLDYIEQMKSLVGSNVPIENEVVSPF